MTRKEAIKRIQSATVYTPEVMEALETLIPELAESEDERIRKAIVHLLEVASEAYLVEATGFKKELFLSYLEKQKVNHVVEWSAYDKATLDYIIEDIEQLYDEAYSAEDTDAYERELNLLRSIHDSVKLSRYTNPAETQDYSGLTDLERAIHRGFLCAGVENVPVGIIKETAQECISQIRPAEWSDSFEEAVADLIERAKQGKCDSLSPIEEGNKLLAIAKHGKVNQQEWSEEEIGHLYTIASYIKSSGYEDDGEFLEGVANKLKSLRPQSKQEWSEEDEKNLELVTDCIYEFYPDPVMKYDLKDWLFSLRNRPKTSDTWKPSEEQMEAIERCVDYLNESENEDCDIMESLYNDLKKL